MTQGNSLTNRQIKALETREKLFNSALSLFAEKGYDNVTIDEIVARAGTSKGAFYIYFKTKYQVVVRQFQEIDNHYNKIQKTLKEYNTASEKMLVLTKAQLTFALKKMGLEVITTVYKSQLNKDEEKAIVNPKRILYKIVNEIIEEGQKTGEFRDDLSSQELTRMVTRCMRATFFDWAVHNGSFDFVEDGYRFISEFIMRALLK
ncbi:MAG: TetR/AcrR family transcriptional regulator [Firmicutes bacterium HGW-Firmicutes-12]|nr:MAG: TetR/AcrR family transcriptional regulator [Firmicutes bacterium HGW-Firmicutes-12]